MYDIFYSITYRIMFRVLTIFVIVRRYIMKGF